MDITDAIKQSGMKLSGRGKLSDATPKRVGLQKWILWSVVGALLVSVSIFIAHITPAMETFDGIPGLIEHTRDSVVHIKKVGDCQGSGVAISEDIIMTARHVTDGSDADTSEYIVTLDDGNEVTVTQVIEDRDNDLAFLKVDKKILTPARLAKEDPVVGEQVLVFGSPLGFDNFNTASPGYVTALARDCYNRKGWEDERKYEWHQMIQSNAPSFPGNSGGPVFNVRGEVVGILVAGQEQTLNFSVPVSRFKYAYWQVSMIFERARYKVLYQEDVVEDYTETGYDEYEVWK